VSTFITGFYVDPDKTPTIPSEAQNKKPCLFFFKIRGLYDNQSIMPLFCVLRVRTSICTLSRNLWVFYANKMNCQGILIDCASYREWSRRARIIYFFPSRRMPLAVWVAVRDTLLTGTIGEDKEISQVLLFK